MLRWRPCQPVAISSEADPAPHLAKKEPAHLERVFFSDTA